MFDQDKNTFGDNRWLASQSSLPNVHVIWTFTHPFRVTSYKIFGQNTDFADRGPKAFLLYGSNDASNWSVVDDMNTSSANHQSTWAENEEKTFTVDTPGDYKYYKLQLSKLLDNSLLLCVKLI